jgi:hypothetical protein
MAVPSCTDAGDRFVVTTGHGSWEVWKHSVLQGSRAYGPGYIGRATLVDGTVITDGAQPGVVANDPRAVGLGSFGWHHLRRTGAPDTTPANTWQHGWDMYGWRASEGFGGFGVAGADVAAEPHRAGLALRLAVGVSFTDGWSVAEQKRTMYVRYDYAFRDHLVEQWCTVVQLPDGPLAGAPVFVKEPKYVVGMSSPGPRRVHFTDVQVWAPNSVPLHGPVPLHSMGDPHRHTLQLRYPQRRSVVYRPVRAPWGWQVRAGAATAAYAAPVAWYGSGLGLDGWAAAANRREPYGNVRCGAYCLQGPPVGSLTRNWELASDPASPATVAMLHGWEGGTGLPDCLCAARAVVPGESWCTYLGYTVVRP